MWKVRSPTLERQFGSCQRSPICLLFSHAMPDQERPPTRRQFAATLGAAVAAKGQEGQRPNIVFVCSDQHSFKYTGYAGHPIVKTPNLDRIAASGVVFENAYCGSPVCVPGRSCMMTGLYPHETSSYCNSTVWDGSHPTWGTMLRNAGYHTEATGKFDLNPDFDIGFEEHETRHAHRTGPDVTSLFRSPVAYRVGERELIKGGPRDTPHADARRAQNCVEFIRDKSPGLGTPWCYYVGFTAPHPAFVAGRTYWDMYPLDQIDVPTVPPEYLDRQHLMFQELRHFKRIATPIPERRIREARAGYYGLVTELDDHVGQVWQALEDTGQLENTIFVYTSDHGEALGDHGLWLKNNLLEPAAHIPLLVAGPSVPAGRRVAHVTSHVDMVQALLEWAGASGGSDLRGHSLLPLMSGTSGDHPGWAYSENHSEGNATGSFMVRKGPWKYIHFTWYEDLLFNLDEDPAELHDLSGDPSARHVLSDLQGILDSEVDTEAVTRAGFAAQERMLERFAKGNSEAALAEILRGRMGDGLARVLAASVKRRYG